MEGASSGNRRWLLRLSGVTAALAAAALLLGIAGLAFRMTSLRPWLAVLLGINGGVGGVSLASLRTVNPIDITVLVLAGLAFIGFWPGPGRPHKVWMGLAILLPFAGIAVLLATHLAGRSGLMGGGLVLSILMLGDRRSRPLGCTGIAANLLLLVGDFATVGPRSVPIAGFVGLGYLLLIGWFAWIATRLLSGEAPPAAGRT